MQRITDMVARVESSFFDSLINIELALDGVSARLTALTHRVMDKVMGPPNVCTECGVFLGAQNPRQFCGKTRCDRS